MIFLFCNSIFAQTIERSKSEDVITFKNGYQSVGKIDNIDLNLVYLIKENGHIAKYYKDDIDIICHSNQSKTCKKSIPKNRLLKSMFIPGLGQADGRQKKAAITFGLLNYSLLAISLYFYNVALSNRNTFSNIKYSLENTKNHQSSVVDSVLKENEYSNKYKTNVQNFNFFFTLTALVYLIQIIHAYNNGFIPLSKVKKDFEVSSNNKNELSEIKTDLIENYNKESLIKKGFNDGSLLQISYALNF